MAIYAHWQGTITDEQGNVIPNANIEVRREVAGSPLAILYSDRAGTLPIGNPFVADTEGFASFYAVGGAYYIRAYNATQERIWRYVAIGTAAENDLENISGRGIIVRTTKAALDLITPTEETDGGYVIDDPDAIKNGIYSRVGGVWVKGRNFPSAVVELVITGGDANTIGANSQNGTDYTRALIYYMDRGVTVNTGNVQMTVDGSAVLPVLDINGDQFAPGTFTGRILLSNEGTHFQALIDANAAATAQAAAASAAISAAEMTAVLAFLQGVQDAAISKPNWSDLLNVNPDFAVWTTAPYDVSPTSERVTSGGAGLGFLPHVTPDGWYLGAGEGATLRFTRYRFPFLGDEGQDFYVEWKWTVAVTGGSYEYAVEDRATYLEQAFERPGGRMDQLYAVDMVVRAPNGDVEIVPELWVSCGTMGWLAGQNKDIGDYVSSSHSGDLWLYEATTAGVTGGSPPVHGSGAVSDGGVTWQFIGTFKGRGYDIYESGPDVLTGTVYATSYEGTPRNSGVDPETHGSILVTNAWQVVRRYIRLPEPGYVNVQDYAGDPVVGDQSRTLLPFENNHALGGQEAGIGIGFAIMGLPDTTKTLEVAYLGATIVERQALWKAPRRITELTAMDFPDKIQRSGAARAILHRGAPVTLQNSTTLTTLLSTVIPGNLLHNAKQIKRKIVINMRAYYYKQNGGAETLTFSGTYGGQNLFQAHSLVMADANPRSFELNIEIVALGDAVQTVHSDMKVGGDGSGDNTQFVSWGARLTATSNLTVNSLIDQTLLLQAQWNVASNNLRFWTRSTTVEIV